MPDLSSETRFMLILRGGKADRDFSPSEYGRTIQKYLDWIEGLRKKESTKLENPWKKLAGSFPARAARLSPTDLSPNQKRLWADISLSKPEILLKLQK